MHDNVVESLSTIDPTLYRRLLAVSNALGINSGNQLLLFDCFFFHKLCFSRRFTLFLETSVSDAAYHRIARPQVMKIVLLLLLLFLLIV
jgi:hypothetical protein